MDRPPFHEIKLTSPQQRSEAIRWVRDLINRRSEKREDGTPKYVREFAVTDVMDEDAGAEIRNALYRWGAPDTMLVPAIGTGTLATLWRWDNGEPLPTAWQERRRARALAPYGRGSGISERSWRLLHPGAFPAGYDMAEGLAVIMGHAKAGLKEQPAGSNRVPALIEQGKALGAQSRFYLMGYAWCAYEFFLGHLAAGSSTARLGLVDAVFWPLFTPTLGNLAEENRFGLRKVNQPLPGCGVLFNFDEQVDEEDHIGAFVEASSTRIVTADGNTSVSASQSNGGACLVRERSRSTVLSYFTIE